MTVSAAFMKNCGYFGTSEWVMPRLRSPSTTCSMSLRPKQKTFRRGRGIVA